MTKQPECGAHVYWWDGEVDDNCELPQGHQGPHHTGYFWFDDNNEEAEPPPGWEEPKTEPKPVTITTCATPWLKIHTIPGQRNLYLWRIQCQHQAAGWITTTQQEFIGDGTYLPPVYTQLRNGDIVEHPAVIK